ncbi:hypothetical protein DFJ74DRAFT_254959 [Hyaloraphidium curvatum]|nr:hypothetical protein DFJ74DRAFT_254959 [Hyaloraphidium curvatum]
MRAILDKLHLAAPNPLYLQPFPGHALTGLLYRCSRRAWRLTAPDVRDGKYDVSKLGVVTAEEEKGEENGRGSSVWVAGGEAVRRLVLRLMHGAPAPPQVGLLQLRCSPDPFWRSVRGKEGGTRGGPVRCRNPPPALKNSGQGWDEKHLVLQVQAGSG